MIILETIEAILLVISSAVLIAFIAIFIPIIKDLNKENDDIQPK